MTTQPKKHFMPAGNAAFEKRKIPTKQEFKWYLTETYVADDPFASKFETAKRKSHRVSGVEFGPWLYVYHTKEFQTRYNAMLKAGPDLWESVRRTVSLMQVEAIGGHS